MGMLALGITYERLDTPPILVYTVVTTLESAMDSWSRWVSATLETWDKTQRYGAIHDFSGLDSAQLLGLLSRYDLFDVVMTTSHSQRVRQLVAFHPALQPALAVVVPPGMERVMQRKRELVASRRTYVQSDVFSARERAVHWLSRSLSPQRT
jgi:hypothetical protein